MNEHSTSLPVLNPTKFLKFPGSSYDLPVSSIDKVLFVWMIPTSFITVKPEISFYWVNLNESPIKTDWLLRYQYFNEGSCLGYFNEKGMPIINYDSGHSDIHTTILKTDNIAEKNIVQKTPTHLFVKSDRRSGTLVEISIQPQAPLEGIYFMGAEIKFSEYPRVIEPIGRKRTYKRRWYDEEPYPYEDS